jgi:hypothetical protein
MSEWVLINYIQTGPSSLGRHGVIVNPDADDGPGEVVEVPLSGFAHRISGERGPEVPSGRRSPDRVRVSRGPAVRPEVSPPQSRFPGPARGRVPRRHDRRRPVAHAWTVDVDPRSPPGAGVIDQCEPNGHGAPPSAWGRVRRRHVPSSGPRTDLRARYSRFREFRADPTVSIGSAPKAGAHGRLTGHGRSATVGEPVDRLSPSSAGRTRRDRWPDSSLGEEAERSCWIPGAEPSVRSRLHRHYSRATRTGDTAGWGSLGGSRRCGPPPAWPARVGSPSGRSTTRPPVRAEFVTQIAV